MESLLPTGIAVIIGFFILLGLYSYYSEIKRSKELEAIAKKLNFSFMGRGNLSYTKGYNLELFKKGNRKRVHNVMHGNYDDMNITIMDYEYIIKGSKSDSNSTSYLQTIIAVQSSQLDLPGFTLSPENIFHKIGGIFGYKDIDFDYNPNFSKKYLLRGKDEESIKKALNDKFLKFYEKNKCLNTEANGDRFIYYKGTKILPSKEIQGFLQEAINLHGLLKTQDSGLH